MPPGGNFEYPKSLMLLSGFICPCACHSGRETEIDWTGGPKLVSGCLLNETTYSVTNHGVKGIIIVLKRSKNTNQDFPPFFVFSCLSQGLTTQLRLAWDSRSTLASASRVRTTAGTSMPFNRFLYWLSPLWTSSRLVL